MTTKAQARSKSKKPTARRAKAHDRRLLAKAERETDEGVKLDPGPAQQLRDAKAKLAEVYENALPVPRLSTERHPASDAAEAAGRIRGEISGLLVPMTLAQVCGVIGTDCKPERFAVTALECLAGQLEAMRTIAERDEVSPYDAFRVIENLTERMRLASRVTAFLESEQPLASLPEVQP